MTKDWRGDDPWRLQEDERGYYWLNTKTGETDRPKVSYVVSDTPEYISPATGKLIHGKRERREDLKKSGCVPFEPLSNRPRGVASERIAKKYGVKVSEAAQHRERAKKLSTLDQLKK
jgi:hypothetical protein